MSAGERHCSRLNRRHAPMVATGMKKFERVKSTLTPPRLFLQPETKKPAGGLLPPFLGAPAGEMIRERLGHHQAMIDVAVKKKRGTPDEVKIRNRVEPVEHRHEFFFPADVIDRVNARDALRMPEADGLGR